MNKKYLLPLLALFLCGCIGNKQIVDTTYTYKKAIVKMPDGEVKEIELSRKISQELEPLESLWIHVEMHIFLFHLHPIHHFIQFTLKRRKLLAWT